MSSTYVRWVAWWILGLVLLAGPAKPARATSWGLNTFSDTVAWSDAIAVAEVVKVRALQKHSEGDRGKVDVAIRVLEQLKGSLPAEVEVDEIDPGDATSFRSPHPPLPDELTGKRLLLFLRRDDEKHSWKGYGRFLVEDSIVRDIAFGDAGYFRTYGGQSFPLVHIRAMVAQLNLIQAACPIRKHDAKNPEAALAACRTALFSEYDPVVWYGARRLLDRRIPESLAPDLIALLRRQDGLFPVGYLLVQCLERTCSETGVPALIEFLRNSGDHDSYTPRALRTITGQDFGRDAHEWQRWWAARQEHTGDATMAAQAVDAVSPEDTVVALRLAVRVGDRRQIEELILPHPEAAILWQERPGRTPLTDAERIQIESDPIRRLQVGDEVNVLGGKTVVVAEGQVTSDRLVLASGPTERDLYPVVRAGGRWRVEVTRLIERFKPRPRRK